MQSRSVLAPLVFINVRAAGWGDNDWVITSPFSFVSSTNVLYMNELHRFCRCGSDDGNIDPQQVEQAVHDLTFLVRLHKNGYLKEYPIQGS